MGEIPRNIPIRLADAIRAMLPDGAELLINPHDAGEDSLMHWRLTCELVRRAGGSD